jgi:hypothetical protein
VVAWNLGKDAPWQEIEAPKTPMQSPSPYKDERGTTWESYFSYSLIADRWIHDALVDLVPVQFKGSAPFGTKVIKPEIIENIQAALNDAEKNEQAAAQKLVSATKGNFALVADEAVRVIKLRNRAVALRAARDLVNEANALAKQGHVKEAISKYTEAKKVPTFNDLNPENEAQTWKVVGQFEKNIADAHQSAASGNLAATKDFFEKAKALSADLWGSRNPEEEAEKLVQQLYVPRPSSSPSQPMPTP